VRARPARAFAIESRSRAGRTIRLERDSNGAACGSSWMAGSGPSWKPARRPDARAAMLWASAMSLLPVAHFGGGIGRAWGKLRAAARRPRRRGRTLPSCPRSSGLVANPRGTKIPFGLTAVKRQGRGRKYVGRHGDCLGARAPRARGGGGAGASTPPG
jgi:hypothetical protein